MRNCFRWVTLLAALAISLSPVAVSAQANVTTGKLHGTVIDPEGAPLAGATVEARRPDTGFMRQAVTDEEGRYAIDLLPPGTFELKVGYAGLRTEFTRDVSVKLGSVVQVDYQLRPAAFTDELFVTAHSPVVDVASSTVSTSVSDTAIANLPLNGRNFSDLILLTPAAVTARIADPFWNIAEYRGGTGGINVGARSVQNSFNIDGTTSQSSFYGDDRGTWFSMAAFTFSQAAIEEFQVIRSDYGLEFSAGGAVVNAITKSGTNEIHGELFGYYRDERFVGADAERREADDFTQLQYGFALGGPIIRDRLHWFFSFDHQDFDEPTWRVFEGFPEGREQEWENLTGLSWDRETGWLTHVTDTRVVSLKLDWQLGTRHLLTARYNRLTIPEARNGATPGWIHGWSNEGQGANDFDTAVLSINSVVAPRLMNEAFVQYSVETSTVIPNTTSIPETLVGWPQYLGYSGQRFVFPVDLSEQRWQVVDNLSYTVGKHLVRGGINFDFVSFEEYWLAYNSGHYHFNSWEDFLDGEIPYNYVQAFGSNDGWVGFDVNTYAAYIQDEWRAAPNLSLIYGFRYDYQQHEQPNNPNPLYPLTGQIPNDRDNVSARFGAAWDLEGDGKAVLRGGMGLFYDPTPSLLDVRAHGDNGVNSVWVTTYCWWEPGCPTYPNRYESIEELPPDSHSDIWVYDPQFENPQTVRMSVGYEREVFRNFSVGIDLMYSRTEDLQSKQDQNMEPTDELTVDGRTIYEHGEVYPDLNRIVMYRSEARANAKSVVLTAHKRFSDRWFLDASYTWSSIRDNGSNQRSISRTRGFPEDQYNIDADWGPANFDVRHKFVVSGGVYLPYGFMFSGYVFARSGFPYSAEHRNDVNLDSYSESERAIVETEPDVYYHYPRNTFRQPWFYTTNLRLSKSFRLGRGTEFELIGEVFNLFDHANRYSTWWWLSEGCYYDRWGNWVPCETWETFGELNRVGSPRQYQLGLRLRF
jgi:hypothetical protein